MAFPTVPTTGANTLLSSATTTASTTHTFPSLTTLAPSAGDLIVAICVQYTGTTGGSPNDQFSSWGAGLTETADLETTTANDLAVGVAHKVATGSETGTFTVTSATSARSVNFLMRIPAGTWHGTTIPEVLAAVRATNAVADPGSFDPSNWAAEDTLWISVYGHSETSTTGSPPTVDAPPTNYSGQLIVARNADAVGHITAGVAFRQLNASSEDVGTWTVSNANRGNGVAVVIAVRPAVATNQTVDLTAATETDSAQALTLAARGQVAWAEFNVPESTSQSVTLTPATETDAAQALTAVKQASVTPATEADAAVAVSLSQASDHDLTPAAETDTAQAVTVAKQVTLTPATETDTAVAVSFGQTSSVDLTPATEADAAQALTAIKQVDLTPATEADSGQAVTLAARGQVAWAEMEIGAPPPTEVDLTPATETDSAQGLTVVKEVTLDAAGQIVGPPPLFDFLQSDRAQAVTVAKYVTLTPAVETDTPVALDVASSGPEPVNLTPATEADAAQAVTVTKYVSLTSAAATDTGVTLDVAKRYTLSPASETDAAQALTIVRQVTLTPPAETDTAVALTVTKPILKTLTPATETDSAVALNIGARIRLGRENTGATVVLEPATGAVEPSYATGAAEPSYSTGGTAVEPALGATELAYATGAVEPSYATGATSINDPNTGATEVDL